MSEDFIPRNYQVELMKIGLEENTIIFLPTGAGKTFIGLMVLKKMSGSLLKSYQNGGKLTIILVETVTLVEQHAKYIENHTILKVGQYSGDMNVDCWRKEKWYEEYEKNQVLVMTSQILLNLVMSNHIDLNKVNLLIFDECHHAVNDHCMRQLMKAFENLLEPPRVIGLTATLLNGNCKLKKVMDQVRVLETTFQGKVATVEGLSEVVGFSTNPKECFKIYEDYFPTCQENIVLASLRRAVSVIDEVEKLPKAFLNLNPNGLQPLENVVGHKKLINLVKGLIADIESMGTYGAVKATICYSVQIEKLKLQCQDLNIIILLNYVLTILVFVRRLLERTMRECNESDQIFKFSSDQILKLLEIFREYKRESKEDICCIVFTKRRFTAKIIYHILDSVSKCLPDFNFLKPDYMVGYNSNPYNNLRENLYLGKKNREVIKSFEARKINVLVASNVLEEGVDIPRCTLVIRCDKSEDYRSFTQSKGRARHKQSLFYVMVEKNNSQKYIEKYRTFQQIEEILNNHLVGKNMKRQGPSQFDIQAMYSEDEVPPYYVRGVGSAQVNMRTAIPLLCQYCVNLPSDSYTDFTPEWYIKYKEIEGTKNSCVVIMLPTICPLSDLIEGPFMKSIKSAKRAAALKACIMLHKIGELDDHLLPKKYEVQQEDVSYLFKHYPTIKEPNAGNSKMRRVHRKLVSQFVQGPIVPDAEYFLHVIDLKPHFSCSSNITDAALYNSYISSVSYGLLTQNSLPHLPEFPIYVTLGTISVKLKVNATTVYLNEQSLDQVKIFHCTVFKDILKIKHPFLVFDNSADAEGLLLVPICKENSTVDFDILNNLRVKPITYLSHEQKSKLETYLEFFMGKIVSPYYRHDSDAYIVTEVSNDMNALTTFPSEGYKNYKEYFEKKYALNILRPELPLLLVKKLTKRLTFIKPKGRETKRKHDKISEEGVEHLLPELLVKQDVPSSLWIQANFVPTILSRISYLLQLEQLRCKIATEIGLDVKNVSNQPPLRLDKYLLNYVPNTKEEEETAVELLAAEEVNLNNLPLSIHKNKDFATALESDYAWKAIDEPKNIEKGLDLNVKDIETYLKFMEIVDSPADFTLRNDKKEVNPTFDDDFVRKPIKLLEKHFSKEGPDTSDLYKSLTTAKANDIVNLERLETLGDSFLKLTASIYVCLRFPKYDEGRLTSLKGRIVSNKNLYYLAEKKSLGGIMKYNELSPKDKWLPPAMCVPREISNRIECKELSVQALFNVKISLEEQVSGNLSEKTKKGMLEVQHPLDDMEESFCASMASFLKSQYIGDKYVADVMESLLGTYFQSCGFLGGVKFLEWLEILPKTELQELLEKPSPDPIFDINARQQNIDFHLPYWKQIEERLCYTFKNPAYLLQALTHSSYTPNRLTPSYEKLEFLGDAVLDFLITCYIYESCGNLNPGELTDLRSALVNNNTFASLVVRCNLHKFLLMINSQLQRLIDRFVEFLRSKHYQIDDEVLVLLNEDEMHLAESIDVPKVLGDIFESLAGAIYLDSGKDLKVVWDVFYKIMYKEIDQFSRNVPKNPVRLLLETQGIDYKFGSSVVSKTKCFIPLQFLHGGRSVIVHGCGFNKTMAKKAAAKLALRILQT